jgi:CheY-like chemotaxis protein
VCILDGAAAESVVSRPGDSPKILVVDDSVDGAEMLAAALSAKGYDTRVAHDAPVALLIAADFRPDVALLDIGLPVMDGYELAARLRELPDLNGMKLIALTGYGQESDRHNRERRGSTITSSNRSTSSSSNQSSPNRRNAPMTAEQPRVDSAVL